MKRNHVLTAVMVLLAACAAEDPREHIPIHGACVRSFATTLAEFERYRGERVPQQCAFLDEDYEVFLVPRDEFPEDCQRANVVGCTKGLQVYIDEDLDPIERVDTSVHEWIHVLSRCVDKDVQMDRDHAMPGLWTRNDGQKSVEAQAQAAAVLGECL